MSRNVFISYSHMDRDQCALLRRNLENHNIKVQVDDVSIDPGSSLRDSIRGLIEASDFTVCLVSANSLKSFWVIWEIRGLLETSPTGKFLPAFLDDAFLREGFVSNMQLEVDGKLQGLTVEMKERLDKGWSVEDLSRNQTNLSSLRNDLPNVVRSLQEICTIDLTRRNFEKGFLEIFRCITGNEAPLASITVADSLENASYAERRRQIEDYIATNELQQAASKTMDLLREFFKKDKDAVRSATRLSGQIRQLLEAYEQESQKLDQIPIEFLEWYNEKVFAYADDLLCLIPTDQFHA